MNYRNMNLNTITYRYRMSGRKGSVALTSPVEMKEFFFSFYFFSNLTYFKIEIKEVSGTLTHSHAYFVTQFSKNMGKCLLLLLLK